MVKIEQHKVAAMIAANMNKAEHSHRSIPQRFSRAHVEVIWELESQIEKAKSLTLDEILEYENVKIVEASLKKEPVE